MGEVYQYMNAVVLPRIVRETCYYRGSETPKVIRARINETKKRARAVAKLEGYKRLHISELYAPYFFSPMDEAPVNPPLKSVDNWSDALWQSHYNDPIGQYSMIIRDQDYLDQLEGRK